MTLSKYEIRGGDTIRSLAQRLLGDFKRWRELVEINQLVYPFISDSSAPGVLSPGDSLIYPGNVPGSPPSDELEAELYGRDLALQDGYLQLQGGTLGLALGLENLRAALERRLSTERGGLPAHPTSYGRKINQYIGGVADDVNLRLIKLELDACCLQDPRAIAVDSSAAHDGRAVARAQARVTPVSPRQVLVVDLDL